MVSKEGEPPIIINCTTSPNTLVVVGEEGGGAAPYINREPMRSLGQSLRQPLITELFGEPAHPKLAGSGSVDQRWK